MTVAVLTNDATFDSSTEFAANIVENRSSTRPLVRRAPSADAM